MDTLTKEFPVQGAPIKHKARLVARHAIMFVLIFFGCAFPLATSSAAPSPKPHRSTLLEQVERINPGAVARALDDMARAWPDRIDAAALRARLGDLAARRESALKTLKNVAGTTTPTAAHANALLADVRAALLANPLLDFGRVLLVRRNARNLGLPMNYESNSSLPRNGIENEFAILGDLRGQSRLETLWRPAQEAFAGDIALHFGADRFLFSSISKDSRWQVFEYNLQHKAVRELPLIPDADVDNYSACYLPDESVLFTSTAPFIGVPCVRGASHVTAIFRYTPATGKIRRLTFDQEHNWCPTVLPDGRVMYLRWEYADIPHFTARILFTMNPDGTNQRELYGSNSYWPNAFFYARPMPGDARKIAGIVGGHHGVARMGELVIIDPAKGRFEADGVVQRIPGFGKKVEPIIKDRLVDDSWPKFLHPAPLNDKYILTACQPTTTSLWGIYLVDAFDNMTLIHEEPGMALLEPTPLQPVKRPPVIPDATKEGEKTARMQIVDIYQGPGLAGVPRGTVKKLRLFTYNFAYHGMGGQWDRVGLDGPWDVKRILGTVPVEPDGSANFEVPANMPISIQPLDERGRAIQLMRSWTTAMPGEAQSCLGCHERQNSVAGGARATLAMRKAPAKIEPFHGPLRGFSFEREVQPVLDRYCIQCHNGQKKAAGAPLPDFTRREPVFAGSSAPSYNKEIKFLPSYLALRAFVRTPTMESDAHLLTPYEYHVSTTELFQILEAGHHGVKLDAESWDRLTTWIDLNTPHYGTWLEIVGEKRMGNQRERRRELLQRYAGLDDDPEAIHPGPQWKPEPAPALASSTAQREKPACPGWPFNAAEAHRRQGSTQTTMPLDLGGGLTMSLTRIPAGRFVSTSAAGLSMTEIPKDFWIGTCEVTNAQYAAFDPLHDNRLEIGDNLHFSERERGWPVNAPDQPVCRVSFDDAQRFCDWLSRRTGKNVRLPDGAAWEYACRAGVETLMSYGGVGADFAPFANLADASLRAVETLDWGLPSGAIPPWRPAIAGVNDGFRVAAPAGSFRPNAWGLRDMHGNVWEWTRDAAGDGRRFVRGGSWWTRPHRATAASTLAYQPWQQVYDVGFRVLIEE